MCEKVLSSFIRQNQLMKSFECGRAYFVVPVEFENVCGELLVGWSNIVCQLFWEFSTMCAPC